jgi:hypothetical protein
MVLTYLILGQKKAAEKTNYSRYINAAKGFDPTTSGLWA